MDLKVSFDDEGRIRLLKEEKHAGSTKLAEESQVFVSNLEEMNSLTGKYIEDFRCQKEKVDQIKRFELGLRNLVEMEKTKRNTKEKELESKILLIDEDIERLREELVSLKKVESQQEEQVSMFKIRA